MITTAWTRFANQCAAVAIGGPGALTSERRERFADLRRAAEQAFAPHTTDRPSHHQTLLMAIGAIVAAPNTVTSAQFAALSAAVAVEREWRTDVQALERRLARAPGNYPPAGQDL